MSRQDPWTESDLVSLCNRAGSVRDESSLRVGESFTFISTSFHSHNSVVLPSIESGLLQTCLD